MSGCHIPINLCPHGIMPGFQQCHYCELDNKLAAINNRINGLHCNKLTQIDLNKKAEERIKKLENTLDHAMAAGEFDVKKIYQKIDNLEQLFYDEKEKFRSSDKTPHKCPICLGERKLPQVKFKNNGSDSIVMDGIKVEAGMTILYGASCHCCEGKGIIWG